jgi:ABC-type sugar transport system permease subunit
MPCAILVRIRELDTRAWRVATWWVPVTFQAVFAVLLGLGWLLSKWPFEPETRFRTIVLTPTIICTVASLLIGAWLLSAESLRRRGFGLAVAGSGVAVLATMLVYAVWVLPWLEPNA